MAVMSWRLTSAVITPKTFLAKVGKWPEHWVKYQGSGWSGHEWLL